MAAVDDFPDFRNQQQGFFRRMELEVAAVGFVGFASDQLRVQQLPDDRGGGALADHQLL